MPNVVKGSKQQKMVVVPHRPARRLVLLLSLGIAIAVSIAAGFAYGFYTNLNQQQVTRDELRALEQEILHLGMENDDLARQLAMQTRSAQMDQQANSELQATITELRTVLAEQRQEIAHYRQVVADQTEDTGLEIGDFDLSATAEPRRYRYKLVMRQQDADGDTYLTGHANINVVGTLGEEQVVIPLRDISSQEELDIRLRFRYFQNIEGELALPEGFVPERIQIAAVATEPVAKRVDQDFPWVNE